MKRKILIALGVALLGVIICSGYVLLKPKKVVSPPQSVETTSEIPEVEEEPEPIAIVNVQPVIDAWGASQSGEYSIVVHDLTTGEIIGEHQKDKIYFAASIYKLYVAYEGYLQAAKGQVDLREPYLGGLTRGECLDAMLRSSDSPCAEKLMAEIGQTALSEKLKTYGIDNTSMTNITTTAHDATKQLVKIHERNELPTELTDLLLDSMKIQDALYRRGLPAGITQATVYNKVGWNELKEWHDTAIVTLPNGRSFVVSIFTEDVGMRNIAALGDQLEQALLTGTAQDDE